MYDDTSAVSDMHENKMQQKFIPVGCVLPAAIAVFPSMHSPSAMHACPAMHAPLPHMPPAMYTPCHTHPCHACPHCHTCPLATHTPYHAHPLPCMPPAMHVPCYACPLSYMPPATHAPHHACAPCHACPLVDRILDTHLWKYYLDATSLRAVIKPRYIKRHCYVDDSNRVCRVEVRTFKDARGRSKGGHEGRMFLGKFGKIVCWHPHLGSWRPHLGEILDPPLDAVNVN